MSTLLQLWQLNLYSPGASPQFAEAHSPREAPSPSHGIPSKTNSCVSERRREIPKNPNSKNALDYYDFNKGALDVMTGLPDDTNGRFAVLGWAHSFITTGSFTRRNVRWCLDE